MKTKNSLNSNLKVIKKFIKLNKSSKIQKSALVSFAFIFALLFLIFLIQGTITLSQSSPTNTNVTLESNNLTHLNVSNSSIVLYMPFDENYNSTFTYDYTNNSNDGTLTGGAVYNTSQAIYGGFYTFDGSNDYIDAGDVADIGKAGSNDSLTISLWFKQDSLAVTKPFMTKWNHGVSATFYLQTDATNSDEIAWYITPIPSDAGSINIITTNTNLASGNWYYLTAVYNGSDSNTSNRANIYVNGGIQAVSAQGTMPKTLVDSTAPLTIGGETSLARYFDGNIDEVMIWNIALNSTQVADIYNNKTQRFHGTGEMLFQNLNFGGNNTINVSLQNCQTNMGSYLRGKINNGNWANFSGCNMTDYSATGTLTNANLTVGFVGGNGTIANTFYTPLVLGNITLDSKLVTPDITINLPTNNTFTTDTSQDVNFTVTGTNLNTCWYSNDTYTANTTLANCNTNVTTVTWSEGQHNVTIYVNNTANIVNSSRVTFTIDTTFPTISFISPTPNDGATAIGDSASLNTTITDATQTAAWFDWNRSLVGYWPMDFRNATGVYDNSTYENFGTAVGGAVFNSSGFYGGAFTFDGVNDFINTVDINTLDGVTGMTTSAWIQIPTLATIKGIVSKWDSSQTQSSWFFETSGSSDELRVWVAGSLGDLGTHNGATTNADLVANKWYHVLAVYDGNGAANADRLKIYVDGVEKTMTYEGTIPASLTSSSYPVEIGRAGNLGRYWNGNIDEVMIFDRVLSATEISALYNNTATRLERNFTSLAGTYNYSVGVIDRAGNYNSTSPGRQVIVTLDGAAPNITSILYSPNSTDNVDPSTNITFTANVTDADGNGVSYVTLQYYNGTTWSNSSMSNNTLSNYTTSIILVSSQQNYTFNIWANDSLGNGNHSVNQTFNSTWDCTWLSTSDMGSTSGWDTNKFIGNISVNNTGDSSHSTGCSLDFRLTYDLAEGRIYFDNVQYKPSSTYTVSAKNNRTIVINASFLSEIKEEAVVITTEEISSRSNTSKLNTTVTILSSQSGPYLFQKVTTSPSAVSLTAGNFSLEGYLRNLMGGTTVNVTNTAYNVTFNWTLPSGLKNVSGTFKTNFTNITDSNLHYNNINVSFSSLASMTSGVKSFYLYAAGVNVSGDAIEDSNNNTIIKKEVNITFSCYATADSVCVTACGVDNDPDCTTSSSTSSTGGGGGSGKAGPSTIMGKSSAEYELVRGREQSFELEIQNRYPGVLENLKISVSGIDEGLIEVFPTEISRIERGASEFLTINLIAPAYFTEGSYVLDFSISGSLVLDDKTTPYTERKRVDLFIVDLSRGDANKMRDDSLEMIKQMNNTNMSLKEVLVFYGLLEKSYEERKFSLVKENYESIKEVYDNAYGSLKLIEELYAGIKDAERRGISVLETKKLLFIGEAVFKRGDYSSSIKRLKEAQLTFALETKGEFNLFYAVKNNPLESAGILLGAIFVTFSSFLSIKYKLYRRKLRMLAEEEKLLLELMKVIQRETFEKNHLSMEEYGQAMSQYETKLSGVIEDKIKTETKLAHFFKLKGKQRALKQEKERLYELVKNLQNDYLNKGKIETRTYENMIKVYSTRITEVEEQLIFIEAKEALSGKVKLKK